MRHQAHMISVVASAAALLPAQIDPCFGAEQIISTNADEANSVYAADVDGDGDLDVLSASSIDDKIAW